jgi:hypothetical protein
MSLSESIGTGFINAFETLGVDPDMARRGAGRYSSVETWIASQTAQAAAVGGATMAVPGAHHAASVIDVATVVHKIAIMSWGVGYKLGCTIDPRLDLANVLSVWSGALPRHVLMTAAGGGLTAGGIAAGIAYYGSAQAAGTAFAAKVASMVAGSATSMVVTKMGAKGAAKISGKVAAQVASNAMTAAAPKIGAKIAAKMGAKHVLGWVPVVGAIAGAGINVWIMTSVSHGAVTYFEAKRQAER